MAKDSWTRAAEFACDDEPTLQDLILEAAKEFIVNGCLDSKRLAGRITDLAESSRVTLDQLDRQADSDDHQEWGA